jgi:hypothetical protein
MVYRHGASRRRASGTALATHPLDPSNRLEQHGAGKSEAETSGFF